MIPRIRWLQRLAILTSMPAYLAFFALLSVYPRTGVAFDQRIATTVAECFVIASLVCSPTALVLFIFTFRGRPGIVRKVFWSIWSLLPIPAGLFLWGLMGVRRLECRKRSCGLDTSIIVTRLEIRGKVQPFPEGRCDARIGHGAKAPCYA